MFYASKWLLWFDEAYDCTIVHGPRCRMELQIYVLNQGASMEKKHARGLKAHMEELGWLLMVHTL